MLIDSHVNLHAPQFADDREAVITRARDAGIGLMVTICDQLANFDTVHQIAVSNPDIWCTVGVHPHEARHYRDLGAQTLVDLAARQKVVGIGEAGLDYHYDLSPRDIQRQVLLVQIEAARRTGLPLILHTRDADADTAQILEDAHGEGAFPLLMHCYTSGQELAKRAAALGAWFSVSGIATFKQADAVRTVIQDMPEDRIIVETDCPYLAPVPLRGRRNEPAYLPHVLATLAQIRGWSIEEAESRTEDAFFSLFRMIPRP